MVYGHYDVQPPDPLNEWITPPFEPTRRNGNIYARGATDDKGQMFTHIKSAEAWIKTAGQLPINLIYLIEGEEEVGSANLEQFLAAHATELACDVIVVSDTSQFAPGQPAITYGLRGLAYYELRLQGPKQDLHSGVFGGAVTNPANALCKILSALRDDQGRVTFPASMTLSHRSPSVNVVSLPIYRSAMKNSSLSYKLLRATSMVNLCMPLVKLVTQHSNDAGHDRRLIFMA